MESVGHIQHQRVKLLNHRFTPLSDHLRSHPPPSLRLPNPRIATTRFPSLYAVASSSSSTPPLRPRRDPASLPDLLLAAVKPVLISLTAATAVLLASPLYRRASSVAHAFAFAARPQSAATTSLEKQKQQNEEQERELESKLRASPDDTDALRDLLEVRVRQNRLPDAVALADRLAALVPDDNELLLLRAHLQNYAGDTQLSRASFEEIIQKDPLVVGAYHGLVMLAAQAEEEGGEEEVKKVMEKVDAALARCREEDRTQETRDFQLLLAQIRVMEGEYEGALQVYKKLVEEEPRDFRPYLCQGVIYTMMEREDEAEEQFDLYRKLVPKGHPYAQYFDENMASLMAFRHVETSKRS